MTFKLVAAYLGLPHKSRGTAPCDVAGKVPTPPFSLYSDSLIGILNIIYLRSSLKFLSDQTCIDTLAF